MKITRKTVISLLILSAISYACLFRIGNLGSIVAYQELGVLPGLKLTFLQLSLFLVFALSNFYILSEFMKLRQGDISRFKRIIFIGVADVIVVWHLTTIATYISIGDSLRDTHGINWYYMDYAGWAITMGIFLLSFIGAILLFAETHYFHKKLRYEKK